LSSISRFIARIGSGAAAAAALALAVAFAVPARADAPLIATYQAQSIRFTHLASNNGATAIGVADPGFLALLRTVGATMTWKPGDRYVLITTAVPVVASFSVGDRRYDVGTIGLQAAFAPYQQGSEVYLPFDDVLRTLDLALRSDGAGSVLQPQLATLDIRASGDRVSVVAHGGAALHPRILDATANSVTYEFDVGTAMGGTRPVNAGGVRSIAIAQSGTIRDPRTLVTVALAPGASYAVPRSNDDRDAVLEFGAAGTAAPPAPSVANASAAPLAPSSNAAPAASPAVVTGVTVQPTADGSTVTVSVTGNAAFEWHRLRDPDNRFWVDIKGAQLSGPPIDQIEPDPLISVRVRQTDPSTVRVALSLAGPKSLAVSPGTGGLTVDVGHDEVADAPRSGSGTVGSVVSAGEQTALVTPAPAGGTGSDDSWKFGPHGPTYVPTNPRLIVIDPGHGGSDRGAMRGGVSEADLALDMSKRLRDILVARGWQVQMTHDTDVDVYAPDDTPHEELQARVDVANNAGARLFVSIHANSFINSGPYGTTCYISKPSDVAFAHFVERQLSSDGTKDDGIVKSHLYVTLHTLMPAVLVETAFLSNPNDFALLTSAAWRQKVAQSIADGIDQYTQTYPVTKQPAQ